MLGELTGEGIASVNQDQARHVDRALVMRDHHGKEVPIGIAQGGAVHVVHHARHGFGHLAREGARLRRGRSGVLPAVPLVRDSPSGRDESEDDGRAEQDSKRMHGDASDQAVALGAPGRR